ncbi:type IV pilin protein [Roseateles sp.]|jgi:prepilin-type N-terminal cleavage/methylation domain-containing protein|uniref:type IV pilin protein n=1 Tax=Roseateles sp. TaxID=1971397 RepID=UPI0037C69F37
MSKQKSQHFNGMSLVELLVACAVLGLVVAVALPTYTSYTTKARLSEAIGMAVPAQMALGEACAGSFLNAADNARLSLPAATGFQTSKVVNSIEAMGLSATEARIKIVLKPFGHVQSGDEIVIDGSCSAAGIAWSAARGSRAELTRLLP